MVAIIIVAIFAGAALGIAAYCLRGLKQIENIRDLYEDYIIDLIEELERYREDNNN